VSPTGWQQGRTRHPRGDARGLRRGACQVGPLPGGRRRRTRSCGSEGARRQAPLVDGGEARGGNDTVHTVRTLCTICTVRLYSSQQRFILAAYSKQSSAAQCVRDTPLHLQYCFYNTATVLARRLPCAEEGAGPAAGGLAAVRCPGPGPGSPAVRQSGGGGGRSLDHAAAGAEPGAPAGHQQPPDCATLVSFRALCVVLLLCLRNARQLCLRNSTKETVQIINANISTVCVCSPGVLPVPFMPFLVSQAPFATPLLSLSVCAALAFFQCQQAGWQPGFAAAAHSGGPPLLPWVSPGNTSSAPPCASWPALGPGHQGRTPPNPGPGTHSTDEQYCRSLDSWGRRCRDGCAPPHTAGVPSVRPIGGGGDTVTGMGMTVMRGPAPLPSPGGLAAGAAVPGPL